MKFCEACHTANKDRARYCCGCKGKFSGVRFAANTTESAFADSREILSMPPVPTRTLDRAGAVHGRRSGMRRGLWLLFVLLVLGVLTFWYSSPRQVFIDWPQVGNTVSSFASSVSSSVTSSVSSTFSSALSSIKGTPASKEVAVVETPVQPAAPVASQPMVPVPAPAPVSRRRGDDGAPKQKGGARDNDTASAFEPQRRAAPVEPVQIEPSNAMSAALQDPAPTVPEAQTVTVSDPASDIAEPKQQRCSEALAALALCPK